MLGHVVSRTNARTQPGTGTVQAVDNQCQAVCIDRTMFSLISGLENYGEALGRAEQAGSCLFSFSQLREFESHRHWEWLLARR
jgi:hypothetical protein